MLAGLTERSGQKMGIIEFVIARETKFSFKPGAILSPGAGWSQISWRFREKAFPKVGNSRPVLGTPSLTCLGLPVL